MESIIIDPNFIVAAAHNANVCLASYSKAQELLDITTVMLENILSCDLGQNDIILLLCCCEPHLGYSGNVSFLNNSSSSVSLEVVHEVASLFHSAQPRLFLYGDVRFD